MDPVEETRMILAGISAALNLADKSVAVGRSVRDHIRTNQRQKASRREIFSLLDVGPGMLRNFRVSTSHPTSPNDVLPIADIEALAAIVDRSLADSVQTLGAFLDDDDVAADFEEDMLLIGSPESEPLTRLIFGYESLQVGLGVGYLGGTMPLVYRWEEEWERTDQALCLQARPGGAIAVRPNWPLMKTQPSPRSIYPRTSNGYLSQDFLIVTKIPNFLTESAWQRGRSIVSVGGLHSVGTRAVELMLNNSDIVFDLLRRVEALSPGTRWLQIVLAVDSIDHDPETGSKPTAVHVHDVVELDIPDSLVKTARSVVASRLEAWKASLLYGHPLANRARVGFELKPPFSPEDQLILDAVSHTGNWSK